MYSVLPFRLGMLTAALLCGSPGIRAAEVCPEFLSASETIRLAARGSLFCFKTTIPTGTAAQFTVAQPIDLALDVQGQGLLLRIDGFEIGTETATFAGVGELTIRILALEQPRPRYLIVSRKAVSLRDGAKFRQAENLATEAKRSQTESSIRESLSFWQNLGDNSAVARTHLKLGEFWDKKENYDLARAAFDIAAELCQELKDVRCRTEALNNSGLESQRLADFDSARSNLLEAAQGWETLKDAGREGITLSNLGLLYSTVHEYRTALSFDQRAAEILERSDRAAFARVLNDFGLCYQALAEYRKAKGYFQLALGIEGSLKGSEHDLVRAEMNLGRTLLSLGEVSAAVIWLERAKVKAERLADRTALADASTNLGQAFVAKGLFAKATSSLGEALRLHRVLNNKRFAAADQHILGVIAVRQGRIEDARLRFTEAASMRSQSNLRLEASDSFYELALLEFQGGNLDAARDLAGKSLALSEKVREEVPGPDLRGSFSAARRKIFDLTVDIEVARGGPDAAGSSFLAAEQGQGRAILDLIAESSLLTSPSHDLQTKKVLLDRKIGMISAEMLYASDKRSLALRGQAGMLVAQRENVDAEIRESQPERKLGHPLDSIERLQRHTLPPKTALLEFHISNPGSYLWLVTASSFELFHLGSQKGIEQQAKEFISLFEQIKARKESVALQKRFDRSRQKLSRELLGNLEGKTLPETLILVCDGALHRMPFEALTIPGGPRALGLAHNLVRVPSAGYLEAGREVRQLSEFPKAFLGVVDPIYSKADLRLGAAASRNPEVAELPRLPFTFELEAVTRLVSSSKRDIFRGPQATKRQLGNLDLGSYAILHFSTHAIIDDTEPELSRVALTLIDRHGVSTDGYLRPAQFASWRLAGSTVVLSACETALGKQVMGEGLWGLTAALLKAGAGRLVLTLSPVDAEGSSEFFSRVYQRLFGRESVSMEQAITAARRDLAANQRWSDPYYWASFVIVGRTAGRI